jgi:putative membrane-bound dehydrogenase-like protein
MRQVCPWIVLIALVAVASVVGLSNRGVLSDDSATQPATTTSRADEPPSAPSEPKRIEVPLNGHVFSLPEGFTIELVAGPPLVNRPITASFDEEGRLYVSDSSGTNDKVQKQLEDKPHRIVRLEDTDSDGKFDKSLVFADKLMFPEGTLWYDGSLYVAAPPSIWKLTDTDGDGVADKREEWFKGNTLTGCANDLHGPYLGPDGYFYWCKGAFAEQTYERSIHVPRSVGEGERSNARNSPITGSPDEKGSVVATKPWVTKAAHIFRARPDAPRDPETGSIQTSAIEAVMTGGMDNPVDVVFTPTGERIFSTTFLVHPGQGNRDGLLHAVYGGVYGKDWNVIDSPSHPRTGDVMPVLCHLGAAAPSGLERLQSSAWGREYQDNLFCCCFNMRKVTRHVLTPKGATFDCVTTDFVVSNNLDFHPTDVLEDADGSLLIVDTGGWYKLCCPTSQLWKPDVLGAIYRVRRATNAVVDRNRLQRYWENIRKNWSKLATLPDDPVARTEQANVLLDLIQQDHNRNLRERATQTLSKYGDFGVNLIQSKLQEPETEFRKHLPLVWALGRIEKSTARTAMRGLLNHKNLDVRSVATYFLSLWRDRDVGIDNLMEWTHIRDLAFSRRVAETLGRIGDPQAVEFLLYFDAAPNVDRFVEHSAIYALIEIGEAAPIRKAVFERQPRADGFPNHDQLLHSTRRALIALDQMPNGGLKPEEVAKYLTSPEPLLRETAAWIISRHADWGEALAGYLRERLASGELTDAEQATLGKQLTQFAKSASVQELLATTARDAKLPTPARLTALRAMRDSGLKELPKTWTAALLSVLGENDIELIELALKTVRAIPPHKDDAASWRGPLLEIGRRTDAYVRAPGSREPGYELATARVDALAALPGGLTAKESDDKLFDFILSQLAPELPVAQRGTAAEVLSKAKLSKPQLEKLTEQFATAGPLEVDRLLGAFEQTTDEQVGQKLIAHLKTAPALTALRADAIKTRLAKYSPSVQEAAQPLYAALNVDLDQQRKQLEELLASLPPGDIVRGQQVFQNEKSACKACHAIGYLGGKTGPDLTRIGGIRNERDLLESILFPSASFVRSFEPVLIETKEGKVINGLIRSETADELILATGPNQEARVLRADIEDMKPSSVSIMPAGLEKQLTKEQLADLIAFLKACK